MIETADLVLDKAKPSDWEAMYRNVWSQPFCAKYMFWDLTTGEAEARARMARTIEFQKTHDAWLVYRRADGEAIGFAGVELRSPTLASEAGICLGPAWAGRGYGKQILSVLMAYARETLGAEDFAAAARAENAASNALIRSLGFAPVGTEDGIDTRNSSPYRLLIYRRRL